MATETQESTYRPVNDAYTGLLTISLIALITGSTLLFLDYQQYPEGSPPAPKKFAPALPKAEPPAEKPPEQPMPMPENKEEEKKNEEMKKDDPKMDEKKNEEMKKE